MSNASFKMNGVEVFSENAQVVTMSSGVVFPNYQLSGIVNINSNSVSQEVTFPSGKNVILWTHWKYVSGSDQRSDSQFITIDGSDNTYTQSGGSWSSSDGPIYDTSITGGTLDSAGTITLATSSLIYVLTIHIFFK